MENNKRVVTLVRDLKTFSKVYPMGYEFKASRIVGRYGDVVLLDQEGVETIVGRSQICK